MLQFSKGKYTIQRWSKSLSTKRIKGFSLVELMLSSLLISVVMLIAWTGLMSALKMSAAAQAKTNLKIELTRGLDVITNEIRQAQAINRTADTVIDGIGVTLADVVTDAGVDLNTLGNYGDIALYLELPTDPTVTSCPSGVPETVDRVVYDIRDSPQSWLPPKVIARYGRIPDERGQINPCHSPIANDIIADSISGQNDVLKNCSGVISGSSGFQTCTAGEQVSLYLNSSVDGVTQKPIETTITPRTVAINPTHPATQTLNQTPSAILSMRPAHLSNLMWNWTVDGRTLSLSEDDSAGYQVQDIDWLVVNRNNHTDIKYQTTVATELGVNMRQSSQYNIVGFSHAHPQLDLTYSTTCFVAHGLTPQGEVIQSNEVCTDHSIHSLLARNDR